MSDIDTPVGFDAIGDDNDSSDVGSTEIPEAVSTETPGEEGGQTEVEGSPETKVFDPSEYSGHLVTVKVDGEELQVPLDEALNGYSRTADYTRKTQELSEVRQQAEAFAAFREKLQADPEGMIEALQSQFGKKAAQEIVDDATASDGDWADDPRLSQMEQRLRRFEQQEEDRLLETTLSGLQETYGESFDAQAVINRAVELGETDINRLGDVYKAMTFDKLFATQLASKQSQENDAADDAARQAAAAAATQASEAGNGVSGGGDAPTSFTSFEDAFQAAVAQHGGL